MPSPPSSAGSDPGLWEPGETEYEVEDSLEREMRGMDGPGATPTDRPPERRPLFVGDKSDFALIGSIFRVVGTSTVETWPVRLLPAPFFALLADPRSPDRKRPSSPTLPPFHSRRSHRQASRTTCRTWIRRARSCPCWRGC